VGKDVEMRKHPGYLQADKGKRLGGQGVRDRVGKTGEKGEQPSHDGVGVNGAWGGRLARVISLASIHPTPRAWVGNAATPENPTSDDTISGEQPADGQAANWLKSLLPEPQSGWWEVQAKGKGFAVKFRWRGTDRQTLLFPQITGAQFVVLKESISGEAARILRKRITASLHSFLLDPDKRDKALVVARKLEIELEIVRRPE
jgi:hypothetical protein